MLELFVAGKFQKKTLPDQSVVCFFQAQLPQAFDSYSEINKPQIWREYYRPFAAVAMNKEQDSITLVRDHLGMEPLFYSVSAERVYVAQSVPELIAILPSKPVLSQEQIPTYYLDLKPYSESTLYKGILRLESGTIAQISRGKILKSPFWKLEKSGPEIHYPSDSDYLRHFSELVEEGVKNALEGSKNPAAEFSAGLDSTAIILASHHLGVTPKLYMHGALPDTDAANIYNDSYERNLIQRLNLKEIQRIFASDFDPLKVDRKSVV